MTTTESPASGAAVDDAAARLAAPIAAPEPATSRQRRTSKPLTAVQLGVVVTLVTVIALVVWFLFYAFVLSGVQEGHDQRVDYSHLRQDLSLATVPVGGVIKPGTPIALMTIPQLKLTHVVVVEGTSSKQLESGPGHLPNSPLPGQAGYSEIFGRSTTFGAPFRSLNSLHVGSAIAVTTGQGRFVYTVADVRVPGQPAPPALQTGQSRLVLVTSQPRGWLHARVPGKVLYVDANLTHGSVQPTPSGGPTVVSTANLPFKSDTSDLIALALWLQLLLIWGVVTAWAWLRWTRPQTWFVAVPAGLAILWLVTSAAMPLLPNLS